MESTRPTDAETIEWLQSQLTHLQQVVRQTNELLHRSYDRIEQQDAKIMELVQLLTDGKKYSRFKTVFKANQSN
jgi:hypothetical protein